MLEGEERLFQEVRFGVARHGDVLNVFNVKNYIDYLNAFGPNGIIGGAYDPHGNISGYPRELRMTLGAKF